MHFSSIPSILKTIGKILVLLIVTISFTGCKLLVATATKNWKKTLIQSSNDRYDLDVMLNLSGGCPQSSYWVSPDSVIIKNGFLPEVIYHLTDRPASRVEFSNVTFQKDVKLDIVYYPKKSTSMRINNDTLLQRIADRIKFSMTYELQPKMVYNFSIVDSIKLFRHKDSINAARIRIPKGMIEFYGCTLKQICSSIENSTKLLIECKTNDTNRYRLTVPGDSLRHMISYFENDCGVKMVGKEKRVDVLKIKFEDKK